jgi:hypothetical protein
MTAERKDDDAFLEILHRLCWGRSPGFDAQRSTAHMNNYSARIRAERFIAIGRTVPAPRALIAVSAMPSAALSERRS